MTNTTNPAPVPPPGSWPAIAAGCTCPIWDNSYGYGHRVNFDDDGRVIARQFILAENCPVHDPAEVCLSCGKPGRGQPCDDCLAELDDPTMRPRTGAGGAHAE